MGVKIQNLTATNHNQNFETYPAFFSQWFSQYYIWDFEILSFRLLTTFCAHSLVSNYLL